MTDQQPEDRTAARRAGDPETWDEQVLQGLMQTPQGRFWMERLLDITGLGAPLYYSDGDALGMAWRDGKAEVGRYLETQLHTYCPDLYLRMVRERRSRADRAVKQQLREQSRRDGAEFQHSGMTSIDAMADDQRNETPPPKPKKPNAR